MMVIADIPALTLFAWAIIGYAMGAVPFGIILSRVMGLGDLRTLGSGNIGATNVLRTGNKTAAALTLLLDAGKGMAAVVLARIWSDEEAAQGNGHVFGGRLGLVLAGWVGVLCNMAGNRQADANLIAVSAGGRGLFGVLVGSVWSPAFNWALYGSGALGVRASSCQHWPFTRRNRTQNW